MIDLKSLQEKAEKANKMLEDAACPNRHIWDNDVWNRYTRAASPETILALCSELSAARERAEKLENALIGIRNSPQVGRHDCCINEKATKGSRYRDRRCINCKQADELLESQKAAK